MHDIIKTSNAPEPIGCYSQAVRAGDTVYVSGQIGLDPATMQLGEGIEAQARLMFKNLLSIVKAAGATSNDVARVSLYLVDMAHFAIVNTIMSEFFSAPYPARSAIGVKELPKGALIEADCIIVF